MEIITKSTSLVDWLKVQLASKNVSQTVQSLATAANTLSKVLRIAPIQGQLGGNGVVNAQNENQQSLDAIGNQIFLQELERLPCAWAFISEEEPEVVFNESAAPDADFVVCFDPLDGSSNIATNGTIGSIFSVFECAAETRQFLPGNLTQEAIVAAGYFLYGPSTLFVLTLGNSVAVFASDLDGEFMFLRDNLTIPKSASEFAINMSYRQNWSPQTAVYIEDCLLGNAGPRARDYNMRWMGSMVADMHRIFTNGGIFLYPASSKAGHSNGKLRVLYEIFPMALLVQVAGGLANSGDKPSLSICISDIHQRAPFVAGSENEVLTYTNDIVLTKE